MFKLLRYYALASLVCILVAAALLTAIYRSVSLQSVVRVAERGNLALGHAVLNSVKDKLLDYLEDVTHASPEALRSRALPSELAAAIRDLMTDTTVVRVKIYNRRGIVVFSTKTSQIGMSQIDNRGFSGAIDGDPVSRIVYRDTFNSFDKATEEDNLLQTYMPVRASQADPIQGVLEIYTNVNSLVDQSERTLFVILSGAALVLVLLYGALLLVVHRANSTIEAQQRIIRERTATLEILSAQMLKNDESQRKQLAMGLNEGLAQTLSAIKLKLEVEAHEAQPAGIRRDALNSVVPLLQAAIEETRTIATALRPSSLDELGLLPTIRWFCREFNAQHPDIHVEQRVSIDENRVAAPLKVVIFRIIESALRTFARDGGTDRIEIALDSTGHAIQLVIDEGPTPTAAATRTDEEGDPGNHFADLLERTHQSGGDFSATRHVTGGVVLSASWPC